jgi:hypothetical protein
MNADRRRSPRIPIEPPMQARVVELDADVAVVEMGFGGFRVRSAVEFEDDAEYEFFVVPRVGCEGLRICATAVHCRMLLREPVVLFETGFAFVKDARSEDGVEALIGSVMSEAVAGPPHR